MAGEHGIKETKEALEGVMELALFLAERLKDGVGLDDAAAVFDKLKNDDLFTARMKAAYEGIGMIDDEMGDLDAEEIVELAACLLPYIPKLVKAFKKEEEAAAPADGGDAAPAE